MSQRACRLAQVRVVGLYAFRRRRGGGWSKQVAVKIDGWKHRTHDGAFHVYNVVCGVACTVALGFFAFHVAGGLLHLLLIIAVISLVIHFFSGRSAA